MASSSRGFATQLEFKFSKLYVSHGLAPSRKRRMCFPRDRFTLLSRIRYCCSNPVVPIRRAKVSGKSNEKVEDWRFDSKKNRVRVQASPAMPFSSAQYVLSSIFFSDTFIVYIAIFAYNLYSYCSSMKF